MRVAFIGFALAFAFIGLFTAFAPAASDAMARCMESQSEATCRHTLR